MDAQGTPTTPSAPRITIEDKLEKHKSGSTVDEWSTLPRPGPDGGSSSGIAGGIYSSRDLNRVASNRLSRAITRESNAEADDGGDDWRRDDGRKKQVFTGTTLMWLAYQSIGVIYGDIGTSPLYVYSSTFTDLPTKNDLIQVLSLIIWSLTLMVTVKYVFIVLHADNEGEGGTFSCYSLLTRFANITNFDPREEATVRIERHNTQDVRPVTRGIRSAIEKSKFTRGFLKTIGVLAVSMVIADGILTPAQSVLGAIQGLSVVKPDISTSTIVGTTCGILVLLFLIQPLGTTKLATTFAPIVIIWLGFNGAFGIYNLVKYDYTVLKAFSPYYAIHFFMEKKTEGWRMLGGVLLCFTGVEALFADLGAFSMRAVQMSWLLWTYPCLILAYSGQAAHLALMPEKYTNPFFNTVPPGMLYPSLILAVLAAIVASQAIITATFQLSSQIMKLSYCPQMKVVHTSSTFHGQVYVPLLNWLLMLGTILVTAVYNNTTSLGHAYGVCVIFVTFFDTLMVTLVAILVWRLPVWLIALPALMFATLDGLYLSSALNKVPDGAWFTLLISALMAGMFLLWRFGKENQWRAEAEDRFQPSTLVTKNKEGMLALTQRWGGDVLSPVSGFGIFFDKTGVQTPSVFTHFASKLGALPDVAVFFHLHPVEVPTVPDSERYHISRFANLAGCYRLVVRHGFMDEVVSPDLGALIYEQVRKFVVQQAASKAAAACGETTTDGSWEDTEGPVELRDEKVAAELAKLDRAYSQKVLYIVGKGQMHIRTGTSILRRFTLGTFLWIRDNTRAKIANLRLAMDRVVEVGFVKEI
ncbi:potassium uptake protein [Colletotrichum scovillei]|uniref:Potassium uptake protein n=1 Tax=Colletotrichum scovillei TaxID=1209932 RepID=A0A9P7RKX3_9PEZI|nr:potassium uptake protein [Colletotrichum scovillei]KAF4777534.1 potassium uptake protein [Colletotrichum scovillei]KAG7059413.1 potassium uptake protein [Colletotrichum scovillei]KAG7077954.1 potassium uptake protein [Colletotrichum scovillei]KAG7085179.1 potassium uptake protein [Colletotrichum scovillei]